MERVSQESDGFFSVSLAERGGGVKSHDKRNPSGVDGFFLNALGMEPPAENEYSSFTANLVQPRAYKRLDPDYYHPERMDALRALNAQSDNIKAARLDEVVNFEREQLKTPTENYLSLAHVQSGTGELADVSDTASGSCFAFQEDNVLFARLRPYLNKVHLAETGGCCSIEFHVLRVKRPSELLPEYLAVALRSSLTLAQTVHMMTGNTHPRLTDDDVRGLIVPIPDMAIQKSIADEARARREDSRRLRAEADALMRGVDDFVMDALGIDVSSLDSRRVFAARLSDLTESSLDPFHHAPRLRGFLNALRAHPSATKPLSAYAEINPQTDVSSLRPSDVVGFIPMNAVSDGATGEYEISNRPFSEVSKGYTRFADGDILWAKITPCMQNGKSCLVENLPNGAGAGSTEFHVVRIKARGILPEFVKEFISQRSLRRVAVHAFTGSAGQQRVPAEFLANLPFPAVSERRQREIVEAIGESRRTARQLRAEAEDGWQSAKRRFERRLLSGEGA